jgi:N-acetylglutamate synthase-like GNAT family acetyltransferase
MSTSTTRTETTQAGMPHVRRADATDLDAVERLLAASGLPLDGVRESLGDFVVAEMDGELVGVAGLEVRSENALLRSVAVAPGQRSHGLGRTLVNRVIAEAEARGLNALYLLTTTAERYFPSFGFHTITRDAVPDDIRTTGEFREACPASATVMCRECAPAAPAARASS